MTPESRQFALDHDLKGGERNMSEPRTEVWWCNWCSEDHPPGHICNKGLWVEFFRVDQRLMVHDYPECGPGSQSVEELYQAFKQRIISELGVRTWDHSGPHDCDLFERNGKD